MKRRSIAGVGLSAMLFVGCAPQQASHEYAIDCSPGNAAMTGSGDIIGSQLQARNQPGIALAPDQQPGGETRLAGSSPEE